MKFADLFKTAVALSPSLQHIQTQLRKDIDEDQAYASAILDYKIQPDEKKSDGENTTLVLDILKHCANATKTPSAAFDRFADILKIEGQDTYSTKDTAQKKLFETFTKDAKQFAKGKKPGRVAPPPARVVTTNTTTPRIPPNLSAMVMARQREMKQTNKSTNIPTPPVKKTETTPTPKPNTDVKQHAFTDDSVLKEFSRNELHFMAERALSVFENCANYIITDKTLKLRYTQTLDTLSKLQTDERYKADTELQTEIIKAQKFIESLNQKYEKLNQKLLFATDSDLKSIPREYDETFWYQLYEKWEYAQHPEKVHFVFTPHQRVLDRICLEFYEVILACMESLKPNSSLAKLASHEYMFMARKREADILKNANERFKKMEEEGQHRKQRQVQPTDLAHTVMFPRINTPVAEPAGSAAAPTTNNFVGTMTGLVHSMIKRFSPRT
jgi:hypothetical protein